MPHLIIEYSQSLASAQQVESMLDYVHQAVQKNGLFDASHIKIRAHPVTFYRVGGTDECFIHAQLRIKPGRTVQQKKSLSDAVLDALKRLAWPARVITVEVIDMDNESYAKFDSMSVTASAD